MTDHSFIPHPGSFRDPAGFLFSRNGHLFRQINRVYEQHYQHLMRSGLYRELIDRKWLIPHAEVEDTPPPDPATASRIIQPEPVTFLSYPYEWCFGQLKAAALLSLRIQLLAMDHGMSLKDCTGFNVQFRGPEPVFIDTLSFETRVSGEPWHAYRQACQHFLAPLALMSYCDPVFGRLLGLHADGIPLSQAARSLPRRTWLRSGLALHIHLHARAERWSAHQAPGGIRKVSERGVRALVDQLAASVASLPSPRAEGYWSRYDPRESYDQDSVAAKTALVDGFLREIRPQTVWDLGAGQGQFASLAARLGAQVLAIDGEHQAVERSFLTARQAGLSIQPVWMDLARPSPGQGWDGQEQVSLVHRGPADCVMALALLHHLAIGNGVPLELIAGWLARLARTLIVELVDVGDRQVDSMLARRRTSLPYGKGPFEDAFLSRFQLIRKAQVGTTDRTLYLMRSMDP
ncbi:MAG: class I SAM-dependent methyltransferase [Gemmatimonadetes bacterium]|nr:class I SAM-dependent methyltransferase [Gemmatimonadota bacterium]